jgi:hypothetical protein
VTLPAKVARAPGASIAQDGAITAAIGAKINRQSVAGGRRGGVDAAPPIVQNPFANQACSGGIDRPMSTLEAASRRLERALDLLEAAIRQGQGDLAAAAARSQAEATLGRDLELMRSECDSLRRALEAAEVRNRRLAEAADEVAGKLERSMQELAELVES